MKRCEVCGNDYENPFEVKFSNDNKSHWFDCFECTVHRLAPNCNECGVRILGHGVQVGNHFFCGAHCARLNGHKEIVDHSEKIFSQ